MSATVLFLHWHLVNQCWCLFPFTVVFRYSRVPAVHDGPSHRMMILSLGSVTC